MKHGRPRLAFVPAEGGRTPLAAGEDTSGDFDPRIACRYFGTPFDRFRHYRFLPVQTGVRSRIAQDKRFVTLDALQKPKIERLPSGLKKLGSA